MENLFIVNISHQANWNSEVHPNRGAVWNLQIIFLLILPLPATARCNFLFFFFSPFFFLLSCSLFSFYCPAEADPLLAVS